MEQVIMNLALQYAKSRGLNAITDKAIDYAYETLGIENEEDYTGGGIYGMRNAFSPANLGRTALKNFATKALTGGSGSGITGALPVFGAALGLGYMTNPLREGSYNYNPNLQGQLDYARSMGNLNRNNSAGALRYAGDSILSGQNAVSGFGTNDYGKQLQNYIDKMEARKTKGYNTIGIGPFQAKTTNFTDFQQSQLDKAKEEQDNFDWDQVDKDRAQEKKEENRKTYSPPYQGQVHGGGGGGGGYNDGDGGGYSGAGEASDWGGGEKDGGFIDGTNRRYFKNGGIASLWQR